MQAVPAGQKVRALPRGGALPPLAAATLGLLRSAGPVRRECRKGLHVIRHMLPVWTVEDADAINAMIVTWCAASDEHGCDGDVTA